MHLPANTGTRLGRVVLVYLAMTVAVITLAPFRFAPAIVNSFSFEWRSFDAVMNVVLFIPVGFIYQLSTQRGTSEGWKRALIIGAALSLCVECAQLLSPGRVLSVPDLIANTAGAGAGAAIAIAAVGRATAAQAVRAFAVELPLMGIVYLLVPLAWLGGLGGAGTGRTWSLALIAASAGWIIGSVYTSFERARVHRILLGAAVWCTVALAPAFVTSPRVVVVASVVCLGASWARAMAPAMFTHEARAGASRRFEATTLRIVLPALVVYLLVSALAPLPGPRRVWMGTLALLPPGQEPTNRVIFRALEHIGAFTVIGYALAEYGGRARDEFRTVIPVVLAVAALVSAGLEIARGWHPAYGASFTLFVLTLAGAGFGGWLYILQLAHVRAIAGKRG